ncbi:2-dehydro-3-deoxygalactonokinase [Paenibacillus piri]|uniref:2-dehydro-3-deoxygalactonokinase n=1 Tax=Paenibacillus piri TaxID=2547395 RepID=A0A4V2ZT20_9BACL|nr:2-dehydro-3-deoxygalactonokinase [Paenibacillus piri]TDF95404.1 hypothetical protein E1757_20020 [Paenibacillus piri]
MLLFVIDAGTTTSRIRLTDGETIIASAKRQIGARDVAMTGSKDVLERALKECIEELLENTGITAERIDAAVASGMISSNMGLYETPHLEAPMNADQLASQLVPQAFTSITDRPFVFIPGVKTGFQAETRLQDKDMMRGEEAEIFGYLDSLGDQRNESVLFMHYGSHHKCILLEEGSITGCRTAITGEMMMAISQNTILKSSLLPVDEIAPDLDWVRQGLQIAGQAGFGRALFSTRVLDTMEKRSKQEASSFFLGTLLALDLQMVGEMIVHGTNRIVLYGKELFPSIFAPVLRETYPSLTVDVISDEQSDLLSAKGAVAIYRQYAGQA